MTEEEIYQEFKTLFMSKEHQFNSLYGWLTFHDILIDICKRRQTNIIIANNGTITRFLDRFTSEIGYVKYTKLTGRRRDGKRIFTNSIVRMVRNNIISRETFIERPSIVNSGCIWTDSTLAFLLKMNS